MAEYIDREEAIKVVSKNDFDGHATWAIKAIPTADVVKVVRCKDCYNHTKTGLCIALSRYGTITTPDYAFCSLGEKRNV